MSKSSSTNRILDIDPDIAKAWTAPASLYTDESLYQQILERVFASSWQLIADAADCSVPRQIHATTMLEGSLDEPIILTRDNDDILHCLGNVCTHRGHLVQTTCAHAGSLRCRYHGRRFNLDGSFASMPEFEQAECFPSEADNLKKIPFENWNGLIFASLNPSYTFGAVIEDINRRAGWLPFDRATFDATRSRTYLVECNWAMYCDNYLEGFHIPFVHAGLNAAIDYDQYRTECLPNAVLQVGVASDGDHTLDLPADSPDSGQHIAAYYYWLFPNTMVNIYPWGVSINIVEPLGVSRTRVRYRTYIWDESKLDAGAGAGLDRVEREDEAIVEATQRGVTSRNYDRGRFSPTREKGVHHFHLMLDECLTT